MFIEAKVVLSFRSVTPDIVTANKYSCRQEESTLSYLVNFIFTCCGAAFLKQILLHLGSLSRTLQRLVLSIALPFLVLGLVYVWSYANNNIISLSAVIFFLLCSLYKLCTFLYNQQTNVIKPSTSIRIIELFDLYAAASLPRNTSNRSKVHPLMTAYLNNLQHPIENFFYSSSEDEADEA